MSKPGQKPIQIDPMEISFEPTKYDADGEAIQPVETEVKSRPKRDRSKPKREKKPAKRKVAKKSKPPATKTEKKAKAKPSKPVTHTTHQNSARIKWLEGGYDELRNQIITDAPPSAAITIGFPSSRSKKPSSKTIGECWYGWKEGEASFITIRPSLFPDRIKILEVLLHEMLHAIYGAEVGHKNPFRSRAKAIGLDGKPTATFAGDELKVKLQAIADKLGDLPSGTGDLSVKKKKQSTRLRKYVCPGCDQIIRAASDELQAQCVPCDVLYEQPGESGEEGGGEEVRSV